MVPCFTIGATLGFAVAKSNHLNFRSISLHEGEREREREKEEWLLAAGSFMLLSAKCSIYVYIWIITSYSSPDNIDIYVYIMCVYHTILTTQDLITPEW